MKSLSSRKIVFIMTDSQRFDMVNCYRETGLKTPNIDKLAQNGIRFERAYTTQPVCQAARAGIFTGQYPHSCAGWTNSMGISDNIHTIGERLTDNGVHSAYIGKWHLDGGDYFGLGRAPNGWDEKYWYDMKNYLEEMSEDDRVLSRDTAIMEREEGCPEDFTYAHHVSEKGIDFLKNYADQDFFLVVSYDEPHGPFLCPKPYSDMYKDYVFPRSKNTEDTLENKPPHQLAWAGGKAEIFTGEIKNQYFFGCNSYADYEIGRVVDAVKQYAPDALIIYTSDHGDMLHSHSLYAKGPAFYDEITRIPLVMEGGGLDKNRVVTNPVSHINLAPTIMELMGLPIPKVFEGKSLLSELCDESNRTNEYIFTEFGRYEVDHDGFGGFQPMRAAFDGRYKLTINLLSSDELYDIKQDPEEMINLIDDTAHYEIRNRIHDAILDNMNNTRDPFRGYYWENRPWRLDAKNKPSWDYTLMTRQREEHDYEDVQLDYGTGLPIKKAVRKKG